MLETLGLDIAPRTASLWAGVLIGLAFGALAEGSRFCLRRAVAGPVAERRAAAGVWLAALAVAIAGTQALAALGRIDLSGHRFLAAEVPVVAILAGGLMFGAGMVLARGCAARLTVLAATGNLRAGFVVLLLAVAAHATMKGVLAPLPATLGAYTLPLPHLAGWPALAPLASLVPGALALALRPGLVGLVQGAGIGALVPLAWAATGWWLADDFDPIALETLSFTAPAADTLFWTLAATALAPGFGIGLVLGTVLGAALSARSGGRAAWVSFTSPRETGRYAAGAVLMGTGGVLAGGCTVGAGLGGVSTLSTAAVLALAAIVAGARLAERALSASPAGSGAPSARPAPQPAE
ncbi:MAG: YeeE/YedE family protein [Gemmobacter sp.]|uniref:YeeE/YedE family protein n=1 Tax=Gemmobacter sp. TaxID=1898957 RepID=UPI0039190E31